MFNKARKWLSERRFWCNLTAAVFALIVCAPLTFWTLDRNPPFILSDGKTVPPVVTAGGVFQMSWNLRLVKKPCEGTVSVRIVDSERKITYILSQHTYLGDYGSLSQTERVVGKEHIMPGSVAAGPAEIFVDNTMRCNPVQRYFWPLRVTHPSVKTTIVVNEESRRGIQGNQGIQGLQGLQGIPGKDK